MDWKIVAKKLLIFGLDGGTWELAAPWAEAGELPTFNRLMVGGRWGSVRSTIPPLTPPGWTTAFTGVGPGIHGVYDFFTRDKDGHNMKLIDSTSRRSPALWEIVSQAEGTVGVLGVPATYPPDRVNGWMLCRMGVPPGAEDWTSPRELSPWIRNFFPDYSHALSTDLLKQGDYEEWERHLHSFTDGYEALALKLLKERPVDTAVVVVDELDRLQHFYWHFWDKGHPAYPGRGFLEEALLRYYKRLDKFLARLLEAGSWDGVILLSDHGFGPLHTDVFLNRYLIEKGWLKLKGRLGRWTLQRRLSRGGKVKPFDWFDWKRSSVHFASVSGRALLENPDHPMDDGDRELLRGELLGLRDPENGSRVIIAAHFKDELWGPGSEGPDWVLEENGRFALRSELVGSLTAPSSQYGVRKTGSHRPEGMGLVYGRGVRPGVLAPGATLTDVAITALDFLGLPAPEDADGHSWLGNDIGVRRWKRLSQVGGAYSEEDADAVEARLRSLGYV